MKLTQAAKTFETNAEFTSQDFTIGDVSVVIEILRNKLYRHKVRTLVQEYISNARDAMREINSSERVQITLPTMYTPTFKVRDFGPGISPDRMYNVFIKYASSTKRDSNKQTGGFGIGAKSAWSYTESFVITTFIDGVQRSYNAHIGANNNGRLDFLGETHTDAPNGTEIQIPVSPKDVREFKQSAFRAVYFWKEEEQPTFVNLAKDEKIEYLQGEMLGNLEVNNNIPDYVVNKYDSGIVVVIDGIPYVAGPSLIDKIESLTELSKNVTGRLVLHLNNGDLEVSASREEIADSKHTTDSISNVGKQALKLVIAKLTKEFAKAKTPFEHLSVYMSLKDSYRLDAYKKYGQYLINDHNAIQSELFTGVKIDRCEMPAPKYELEKDNLNRTGRRSYYSRGAHIKAEWFDKLYFSDGSETALITNYRLKALLANQPTVIIFTKKDDDTGQFDKVKKDLGLKDIKTIAYVKPERKAREVLKIERTKQEFCIHRMDRYSNCAHYLTQESNTQKWLWVERKGGESTTLHDLNNYVESRGYKICALSKDAIRRVKGDKNFKPLAEFLATFKATKEDITWLKIEAAKNMDMMGKLAKLVGLTDMFLVGMIEEYKTLKGVHPLPEQIKKLIGKVDEVDQFKKDDAMLSSELKNRYGLLELIHWSNRASDLAEITCYINSK